MTVSIYEDFFEKSVLNDIVNHSDWVLRARSRMMFTSMTWGQDVIHDSPPVLIHPLPSNDRLRAVIADAITAKVKYTPSENNILFYYWPVNSYIPWHTDVNGVGGMTVYLNKQWSRDNGGLFLYEDQGKINGIVPKQNLCVLQTGRTMHSTTPVLPRGKLRCTLQVWLS